MPDDQRVLARYTCSHCHHEGIALASADQPLVRCSCGIEMLGEALTLPLRPTPEGDAPQTRSLQNQLNAPGTNVDRAGSPAPITKPPLRVKGVRQRQNSSSLTPQEFAAKYFGVLTARLHHDT